jgi:pimeloyl-ACP methyl ester carboxylesterase
MSMKHVFVELHGVSAGSKAFLSTNKLADTALVFVHGFTGDPIRTWKDFPGIADIKAHLLHWTTSDLYFFNYQDATKSIDDSSDDLERFLNKVYPSPVDVVEDSCNRVKKQPQGTPIRYSRLILVGHSEGGVVIRACIAELGKRLYAHSASSPILGARVVLFAPALFGFLPTNWLGLLCQIFPLKQLIDLATTWSIPAAEMRDVRTLDQVREINEKLWCDFPEHEAFIAHVVFGENEAVVRRQRYLQDHKYPAVKGKDHGSVCKPNSEYQEPLPFVMGAD